jgi:hypothetical protein
VVLVQRAEGSALAMHMVIEEEPLACWLLLGM